MELGGKSASIILDDADLELAVNGSLCSIFLNQGQMCTAMSRILVQDGIYDEFINGFIAKAKGIKLGNGLDLETQMGPLVSQWQREKVIEYIEMPEKLKEKYQYFTQADMSKLKQTGCMLSMWWPSPQECDRAKCWLYIGRT